jgi:rhodanese-related sulfurtransferase
VFIKPDQLIMIPSKELHQLMQDNDIFLVDVHIPEQKHIIGTDLFVPFYKVDNNLKQFPQDKQTPIYLYCESGPMGNAAARVLINAGYTEVYSLEGGTDAWLEEGYTVE